MKAVIPVAGLGTRFLPATKAIPKEMLPIVDKPLIQYAIEEAIVAGISEFIFITRHDKGVIEDHFKQAVELERELRNKGKQALLDSVNFISSGDISFTSIIQETPLGLGHAVLCAKEVIDDEVFAIILPDDLIYDGNRGCLQQMVDVYKQYGYGNIAVENVASHETDKYGIVSIQNQGKPANVITGIIEKPQPDVAPSTLAVVGRYILPSAIFALLEKTEKGAGGEIQITDAIAMLLDQQTLLAYEFEGKRYDCGSKFGYLQANVEYGLRDPELADMFSEYIASIQSAGTRI